MRFPTIDAPVTGDESEQTAPFIDPDDDRFVIFPDGRRLARIMGGDGTEENDGDDDGENEGDDAEDSEDDADEADEEDGDEDDKDGDGEKLKSALQKERKAARTARKRAKDAEAERDTLKTENESLKTQLADAGKGESEVPELKATVLRYEVAADKGLDLKLAKRLSGSTREELEADADELVTQLGRTGDDDPDFDGGPRKKAPKKKDPAQAHNDLLIRAIAGGSVADSDDE